MSLGSSTKIRWLGHSAFSFELSTGQVVLLDPWLTENPSCPEECRHPARVDAILVTHGHRDHLGDTLGLARRHGALVIANYEISLYLQSEGVSPDRVKGMNKGGTTEVVPGMNATMVHADHSSSITGPDGRPIYAGEPAGFVLTHKFGPTIYAAGDTALFGDMSLIGALHQPQYAILPIGGYFTMDPFQAARAAAMLRVKAVVPCHYGTFSVLEGTPTILRHALQEEIEILETSPGGELP